MPHVHRIRRQISRRIFLADLGRGGVAAAVGIGLIACGGDEDEGPTAEVSESTATSSTTAGTATAAGSPSVAATATTGGVLGTATGAPSSSGASGLVAVEWGRANLWFVSAYVLARGGEATIVDTGVEGSEGAIEEALGALGLGWGDVGHVILTHRHGDHAGSLPAVLAAAADATGYAGAADIGGISSPRALVALADGDRVFDLEIIGTPGHTAGHVSVLDRVGGILVAGDAINGADGGVIGPNAQFTPDMTVANESVAKLAGLPFETILFGHGEPVLSGGSARVAALVG
ncbi:MAG: MBL fold metallo-hydrolase [Chloroflexi bacterium]|nr:MBL fold metallo-hydrolase [Chloroflexota bacterium]MDA1145885.1 MBL fold metallo-hydrolase [Chloroflexota bacterium]